MNPEKFQTLSQIVAFLGAVVAAVGVLGSGYFGRRADNFKSEQRKAEQVAFDQKLDSLVVGNRDLQGQLQPFLELARKRFPELAPDQALEKLRESIDQLQQRTGSLEQRLRPRELSLADISEIAGTLRAAGSFKVHMIRGSGDAEAARLAEQLKAAFVQAGWTVEKRQRRSHRNPWFL